MRDHNRGRVGRTFGSHTPLHIMTEQRTPPIGYYASVQIAILLGMILGGVMALCLSIIIWYVV